MKKATTLILFFLYPLLVFCQDTEWASKVISYSTQLSDYAYAATQVLGKPNVLPNGGDNPNAWMPSRPDRISEIKVGFEHPMKVQQVAIAESFHPGSVYQVYLYDAAGGEHLLATFTPHPLTGQSRMMNIYINETPYEVDAVRVVLDCASVPGYNAIDAIGISGSKEPITAGVNLAFRKNPDRQNTALTLDVSNDSSDSRPFASDLLERLFFTRKYNAGNVGGGQDPEDIWSAAIDKNNGNPGTPENIGKLINNEGPNVLGSVGMLFGKPALIAGNAAGKNGKLQTGVYYSLWDGNNWSVPEELKIKNAHIDSWDADYFLTGDGRILFFSAMRYDTEGGKDLYVCRNDGKGRFSEPQNLGSQLNTALDEICPFFAPDEHALYYGTAGLTGFGKTDIYRTTPLDSTFTRWTEPENIGGDINTPGDEKYFNFTANCRYAYFARDTGDQVYRIVKIERPHFMEPSPLVTLRGSVLDDKSKSPVNSRLMFELIPDQIEYGITVSNGANGEYEILLPSGNHYRIKSEAEGYDSTEVSVALENKNRAYGYTLDLSMSHSKEIAVASAGDGTDKTAQAAAKDNQKKLVKKMDFDNSGLNEIIFDFDSGIPVKASLPVIEEYIKFMADNKSIKAEVAGFTDYIGNEKYNHDLSVRRALWVKNYMVGKGISRYRIRIRGFGENLLLTMSDNENLRLNRRVEFNFTR